jgi:hypothetical protein
LTNVRNFTVCVVAVLLSIVVVRPQATEWFVAPGGTGAGTREAPFGLVQDGLNAAHAGDTVTVLPGTYAESVRTVRSGAPERPIRVVAEGMRGSAILTAPGRVLRVDHAHLVVEGLVFDGQYGERDTVDVNDGGHFFTLRNVEVRRSSRELIDMGAPHGVLIEDSLIHHALNATNGRTDAHGIAAGAVRDLTIRNTEIHTFSGDGLQVDPGREAPGWDRVTLEGARIWLAPLPAAENGFPAGAVPGENAIDTKASANLPRATLVVRNTTASGFRGGLIGNMAAFNLKENVAATLDGITVYDSEIAFRLRGFTTSERGGAWVTIMNALVYDTTTAFRYEQDIEHLRIWNSTLGAGVTRPFQAAESGRDGLDVRNLLVFGPLPREVAHPSNWSVGSEAFVDAAANDYTLAAGATVVDAGIALADVTTDRIGTARPQGRAYDVGAYEWIPVLANRAR